MTDTHKLSFKALKIQCESSTAHQASLKTWFEIYDLDVYLHGYRRDA